MGCSKLTDTDLIERCLQGSEEAWEVLVQRYRRLVYSVLVEMRLPSQDADDVFQESWAALLRKLPGLRDRERVGLWLAVTARRKALDRFRRGPARREVEAPDGSVRTDPSPLPDSRLLELERQGRVRQAVGRLSQRCQELLEGLYYTDPPLAYRELARRLGVPEGSVGPTRLRCLGKLKKLLAPEQAE